MKYLFIIIQCLLLFACNSSETKKERSVKGEVRNETHFSINDSAELRIITIYEPFLGSEQTERYVLYPKVKGIPKGVSADVFIGLPINRIGINSTTHLGFLNAIDQQSKIIAASNLNLYYDSDFQQKITNGEVIDIGNRSLDSELIIERELDVLFTFAIDAASYDNVLQLRELGQPVVLISEFMESNPLDKAKWLEVFAAFFEDSIQQKAENHLNMIAENYNSLNQQAKLYSKLPSVSIGLPWKGTWYVSGGESYQAQLIRDAAALYCWESYKQTASVPLDIETAISKGLESSFWINTGSLTTSKELESSNEIFTKFKSFENKTIFTNYKRSNKFGANDYWEMGVVRPDLILNDLISIFHAKETDSLTFYQTVFE